jgi:hypothetical protein
MGELDPASLGGDRRNALARQGKASKTKRDRHGGSSGSLAFVLVASDRESDRERR